MSVGAELAPLAVENKGVGTVPIFDDLQAVVNFAAQRFQAKVIAQERGLQTFAQLAERLSLWAGDPPQIHIAHAKGGADRYVPVLPALAHELRTHLQGRQRGFLFESNRHPRYSRRTVQSIVTRCARSAGIKKRVFPHLLRHSIATILLDSGLVPIDQVQKFLGHTHRSTTQIYPQTSLRARGESYIRALGSKLTPAKE